MRSVVLLLLLLPACGRVGDPLPPFIRVPEPVKDLSAIQSGYDLVLAWTNPPRYVDGSTATNLAQIQIRTDGAALARVDVNAPGQRQSYVIPTGPITGRQRTFTVIAETAQGKLSDISNVVSITPVEVPGSVSQLSATADQRRILLQWDWPREHSDLADVFIVTRSDIPAEAESVPATRYEDTRYEAGKSFTYHVTAARRVEGAIVMGVGPEEVTVTAEDKAPPAAPTSLEITITDTGAILTWEPNAESDLAGYRVFRGERSDAGFKALGDAILVSNRFFDMSYRSGLYYAVAAVDDSGNESAMSAPFRAP